MKQVIANLESQLIQIYLADRETESTDQSSSDGSGTSSAFIAGVVVAVGVFAVLVAVSCGVIVCYIYRRKTSSKKLYV